MPWNLNSREFTGNFLLSVLFCRDTSILFSFSLIRGGSQSVLIGAAEVLQSVVSSRACRGICSFLPWKLANDRWNRLAGSRHGTSTKTLLGCCAVEGAAAAAVAERRGAAGGQLPGGEQRHGQRRDGENRRGEPQTGQRKPSHLHHAPHAHHPHYLALQTPPLSVSARDGTGDDLR